MGKLLQNEKSLVSVSPNLRCTILSPHFNISEIRCDWLYIYIFNMLVFLNSSFFLEKLFLVSGIIYNLCYFGIEAFGNQSFEELLGD